ncbi:MAG: hypothetical protein R8M45_04400 [Ghiorsea sp.]
MARKIKRDCGDFLSVSNGVPLYRAMAIEKETLMRKYTVKRGRRKAKPDRVVAKTEALFDKYTKKEFGESFRSGSMYATTQYNDTLIYAVNIFAVFPLDGFKFLWSPKVKDFSIDSYNKYKAVPQYERGEVDSSAVIEVFDSMKYTNSNLKAALKSQHEIMFDVPRGYYAMPILEWGIGKYKNAATDNGFPSLEVELEK